MQKYTLFIGIDISKKTIDVCLTLDGNKKQMPHRCVENSLKGFREMMKFIQQWLKARIKESPQEQASLKDKARWFFCMEHTGIYTYPLIQFLQKKQLSFHMVNPLHLKHSLGVRRGKNDQADAADIAFYLFVHHSRVVPTTILNDNLLKIKNLLSVRGRLVKSRKGLATASNELEKFMPRSLHKDVSRYSKKNIKVMKQTIKDIEKQMLEIINKDDELLRLYNLVTSVKGAGIIIACSMLVYTHGFTAFETSRQFATYVGLAPFARQSGTSVNVPAKVSHMANKKLKGYISCGASSAMRHDKQLKAYYERRLAEGKNEYTVKNAVRNKFLHRIFAVVKRGTPYVELDLHQG